ncbi:Ig-like domain-containing protein [Granulicella pectinivorans]
MLGCGQETVVIPDTTRPVVISTNPANGATGVLLNQAITAVFSKALTASTVNATSFTVTAGGSAVAGTVSYSATGNVATFTPSASLAPGTLYTGTLTTAIADTASPSNSLATNYTWTFTTAFLPVVTSTAPVNGATSVPLAQVVSATFSKVMNPSTISASTFTVTASGVAVPGTVSYAGSTATFTPTVALASGTVFVATITSGAQDTNGYGLAANYVWSFTTVIVPPVVISTIPANGATNVPIAQTLSATFSKTMKATSINAATFTLTAGGVPVAGTVAYSGTVATFTPAVNLLSNTAYTATITTGAQDASGNPLTNNYVWSFTTVAVPPTVISTIPVAGATGVPITQAISVTFSKAMSPATLTNATFTVTAVSGAIAGNVTYAGLTATFTPNANLPAGTLLTATITTGAKDTTGTALGANYVWMFRTVPAPTPPAVISTVPLNAATGVPLNQAISATFSEAVDPSTVTAATFTLSAGGVPVAGVVTYVAAGSVATFTPAAPLVATTLYTATITTGVKDLSGTALAANYVWTFTTGAAPDTTPPTVIATNPLNNATAVPYNQAVTATFSKAINATTINATTFTLASPGGVLVPGAVTYAAVGVTATFTPTVNLLPNTLYTATVTTGVKDLAGNALAANYVFTFTTSALPNTTPPFVTLTNPINNATGVPINMAVSATFSEAMDPLTLTTATYTLVSSGGVAVAATVSYDPVTFIATLTPTANLASGTTYIATVTSGAKDLAGNALVNAGGVANPWMFTTGAAIIVPPVNLGTSSLFGAYGGAGITNQGIFTVINGNLGTTGVSTTVTGFHDNTPGCVYTETPLNIGLVNGAIDTAPPPPTVFCPNEGTAVTSAISAQAALDALNAYNTLAGMPGGLDVSNCPGCGGGQAGELGNRTLSPGIYKSAAASFSMTQGDLTLDAHGDPNAFWIFQMSTSLTVGTPSSNRNVLLVNGAQAKNVFWQVGTAATINGILGGGTMVGTIISQAGVSVSTAGVVAITTLNGRAMALFGPVTVVNTVINVPAP